MTSEPILEVPRRVFNKANDHEAACLDSPVCFLGKPIEFYVSIRASTKPNLLEGMSDTNAPSKLRYLQTLLAVVVERISPRVSPFA
jgi:hypothetical protein